MLLACRSCYHILVNIRSGSSDFRKWASKYYASPLSSEAVDADFWEASDLRSLPPPRERDSFPS